MLPKNIQRLLGKQASMFLCRISRSKISSVHVMCSSPSVSKDFQVTTTSLAPTNLRSSQVLSTECKLQKLFSQSSPVARLCSLELRTRKTSTKLSKICILSYRNTRKKLFLSLSSDYRLVNYFPGIPCMFLLIKSKSCSKYIL